MKTMLDVVKELIWIRECNPKHVEIDEAAYAMNIHVSYGGYEPPYGYARLINSKSGEQVDIVFFSIGEMYFAPNIHSVLHDRLDIIAAWAIIYGVAGSSFGPKAYLVLKSSTGICSINEIEPVLYRYWLEDEPYLSPLKSDPERVLFDAILMHGSATGKSVLRNALTSIYTLKDPCHIKDEGYLRVCKTLKNIFKIVDVNTSVSSR